MYLTTYILAKTGKDYYCLDDDTLNVYSICVQTNLYNKVFDGIEIIELGISNCEVLIGYGEKLVLVPNYSDENIIILDPKTRVTKTLRINCNKKTRLHLAEIVNDNLYIIPLYSKDSFFCIDLNNGNSISIDTRITEKENRIIMNSYNKNGVIYVFPNQSDYFLECKNLRISMIKLDRRFCCMSADDRFLYGIKETNVEIMDYSLNHVDTLECPFKNYEVFRLIVAPFVYSFLSSNSNVVMLYFPLNKEWLTYDYNIYIKKGVGWHYWSYIETGENVLIGAKGAPILLCEANGNVKKKEIMLKEEDASLFTVECCKKILLTEKKINECERITIEGFISLI